MHACIHTWTHTTIDTCVHTDRSGRSHIDSHAHTANSSGRNSVQALQFMCGHSQHGSECVGTRSTAVNVCTCMQAYQRATIPCTHAPSHWHTHVFVLKTPSHTDTHKFWDIDCEHRRWPWPASVSWVLSRRHHRRASEHWHSQIEALSCSQIVMLKWMALHFLHASSVFCSHNVFHFLQGKLCVLRCWHSYSVYLYVVI